jgi:hypothetical protein
VYGTKKKENWKKQKGKEIKLWVEMMVNQSRHKAMSV